MKTFEHFPEILVCPICKTSHDSPATLVPVDGTQDGNIEEAIPVHVKCIENLSFRFIDTKDILYTRIGNRS